MHVSRLLSQAVIVSAVFAGLYCAPARAENTVTVQDLQKEVEQLRHNLLDRERPNAPIGAADAASENRFGPDAPVTSKNGKLVIGGLLQIWSTRTSMDHQDFFGDKGAYAGSGGTSEALDNETYRIRRTQLKFTMDIHENITSVLMVDPSNEPTSFPELPSNQGLFKSTRENPSIASDGAIPISSTSVGRVQTGAGRSNALLQDAYIRVHDLIPHHDFTAGQFKPKIGEEGPRDDGSLDFAERAMIDRENELRDLGLQVHGTWWDDKVQYWTGILDGAGNFFNTAGPFQNRSDDNNDKDVFGTLMVRPFWEKGALGNLELGYSNQYGLHGESGDLTNDGSGPINGLNRRTTAADRQSAWIYYKPMGRVHGLWLRAEAGSQKDRTVPFSVDAFGLGSGPNGEQAAPRPFRREGFYAGVGYRLSESVFAERLSHGGFFNNLLQPVEFKFRYEQFQNIVTEDLVQPDVHTDLFKTNVLLAGVNYYQNKMKVQMDIMVVDERQDNKNQGFRRFHEVMNNVFMFSYQITF